jgi:hypothetical protein
LFLNKFWHDFNLAICSTFGIQSNAVMKKQISLRLQIASFQRQVVAAVKVGALAMAMLMVASGAGHGSSLNDVPQVKDAIEEVQEQNFDAYAYAASKGMKIDQNFEQDLKVALKAKFQVNAPAQAVAIKLNSFDMIYAYFGLIGLVALFGIKKAFFH